MRTPHLRSFLALALACSASGVSARAAGPDERTPGLWARFYFVGKPMEQLPVLVANQTPNVSVVVPVDWVATALLGLLFKRDVWFDTYHLSAGEDAYSTFAQIEAAIAQGRGVEPWGDRFQRVTQRELTKAVYENRSRLSNANPLILARALSLYSQFADSGVLFDNARTLNEGIAPPPSFHSYAAACAETAEGTSIATQMEDDFK